MKITNRGFSITEVCPAVSAVQSDGKVAYVHLFADTGQHFVSGGMLVADVDKLIEALQETKRLMLMTGEAPVTPPSDTRAVIVDGDGDEWTPVPGTDLYAYDYLKYTRDKIQSTYGIREG